MEEPIYPIAILLLGWLLGTLSPAISDAIKTRRDAASSRKAIENELQELSSILVLAGFRASSSAGRLNRGFLEWQRVKLQAMPNDERAARFLELTERLLQFPDHEIGMACARLGSRETTATLLQKYAVPLLDYRVSALQTFDEQFQVRLLEIRRNISLLDSIVDQSREFYRLTFEQLPNVNHDLVNANLKQTYGEYAERSKVVVDQIHALREANPALRTGRLRRKRHA